MISACYILVDHWGKWGQGYPPFPQLFIPSRKRKEGTTIRELRGKRVKAIKEGTLIATVDISLTTNTGYCTALDGRDTKPSRFDETKEGFEEFWCITMANKNRFGYDEVVVGYVRIAFILSGVVPLGKAFLNVRSNCRPQVSNLGKPLWKR